jgi:signal transduction histidine kinase
MVLRQSLHPHQSMLGRSAEAATAALSRAAESMLARVELVLTDGESLPPDVRGLLSGAKRDGERLRAAVEDIGDLALADNPAALEFDLADVTAIAHDALQLLWPRAFPTGRRFDLRADPHTWLLVDGRRIGKALRRMVEHALDTSGSGTTIEVQVRGDSISISYEPDPGNDSHDPLGLALAESIGRAHGGGLSLAEGDDRVVLTLSLAVSDAEARAA